MGWVNMDALNQDPLSESVQMYLVSIARLQPEGQPLPLSRLADALSISLVSVNEMCHKLQDRNLVTYRPYKGVMLTQEGQQRAHHTLRRHRLWEVFLVDKLGFDYEQAHSVSCELEHATPDVLAHRLDMFLEHPVVNPRGEPIPQRDAVGAPSMAVPLTEFRAGQRAHVRHREVSESARSFLDAQEIRPGTPLTVVGVAEDSILVLARGKHVSLARDLARSVLAEMGSAKEMDDEAGGQPSAPGSYGEADGAEGDA